MSRAAGLLVCGVMISLGGPVAARGRTAPKPVVLDYRRLAGAEACPTKAQLEAQVRDILGRPSFARGARRKVRCVLRGEGGTMEARVQLLDTRSGRVLGVRQLSAQGPGCEELGGAVALAIALAIDPLAKPPPPRSPPGSGAAGVASAAPHAPPPPPPPVTTAPRSTAPVERRLAPDAGPALGLVPLVAAMTAPDAGISLPPPDAGPMAPADAGTAAVGAGPPDAGPPLTPVDAGPPALVPDAGPEGPVPDAGVPPLAEEAPAVAAASSPSGWHPVVGAGAVGAAGVLPGFAGGALVHAGAASSTASVEAELRWLPGTSLAFGTGTISTSLVSGALVGCARFGAWAACGLTQAGPLSAKGQGYSRSQEASAWMVSVGARAQWEWMFADPVGLRLHLDGAVNVVRPRLLVDRQEAWTTPPVSVWVGGGVFGRF